MQAVSIAVMKRAKLLFGRPEPEPQPVAPKKAATPHHAVTIVPGPRACAASLDLREQRFLSREAPSLPLRKCDSSNCACRYQHHDDRRKGRRRLREMAVSVDGYSSEEHRSKQKRGRRKDDT